MSGRTNIIKNLVDFYERKHKKYLVRNVEKFVSECKHYPFLKGFLEKYRQEECFYSDNEVEKEIVFFSYDLTDEEIDFMVKSATDNEKKVGMFSNIECLQIKFEKHKRILDNNEIIILPYSRLVIIYKQYEGLTYSHYHKQWEFHTERRCKTLIINDDFSSISFINGGKKNIYFIPTSMRSLELLSKDLCGQLEKSYLINSIYKGYEEVFNNRIYKDAYNDFENACTNSLIKIFELKDYRTKKDLYLTKKEIKENINIIGKKKLNKLSFSQLYDLYCYIKYFKNYLLFYLINFTDIVHDSYYSNQTQKSIAIDLFGKACTFISDDFRVICDIKRMLSFFSLKEIRQINFKYPTKKNLSELHDFLVDNLNDEKFEKMTGVSKKVNYPPNSIYVKIVENLPKGWSILYPRDLPKEGCIMNNCIGSYSKKIEKGSSGLYSGIINGHRYNAELEVDEYNNQLIISQLFGKKNSKPIKEDVQEFIEYIKTININYYN